MSRNWDVNVKSTKTWKIKLLPFCLQNEEYEKEKYFLKNINAMYTIVNLLIIKHIQNTSIQNC